MYKVISPGNLSLSSYRQITSLVGSLQTCNLCIIMYMMELMFGQSLINTGVTVIVLHAKVTPHFNVLHETIRYHFHGN